VFVETTLESGFKLTPAALDRAITEDQVGDPQLAVESVRRRLHRGRTEGAADVLLKHPNVWVLSDDIYEHLTYDDFRFTTPAEAEPALKDAHADAERRLQGLLHDRLAHRLRRRAPQVLIKAMAKLQSQSTSNPSSISQWAAVEALNGPQDFIPRNAEVFRSGAIWWFRCSTRRRHHLPAARGRVLRLSFVRGHDLGKTRPRARIGSDEDFVTALLGGRRGGGARRRLRPVAVLPHLLRHLERGAGGGLRAHPAVVSAPNGKLGAFAGSLAGEAAYGVGGSLAVPLHDQFGAQLDGLVGTAAGGTFYGIGVHLFWRDPSKGLLGAYASYAAWDTTSTISVSDPIDGIATVAGATVGKVGVEGEAYFDRVSLEGLAAYQFGTNSGFAGKATLALYPTDDLRLDIGARYLEGPGASLAGGLEWSPPGTAVSFFADGSLGQNGSWSALGGLKVFFGGEQKSLIRRHREDDPDNMLPDDLYTIVGEGRCPVGTIELSGFCDSNV
jgi:hypothetical protein